MMIIFPIFTILFAITLMAGCSFLSEKLGLKDDNEIEEIVEEVIRQETGLDLDLTPNSEE